MEILFKVKCGGGGGGGSCSPQLPCTECTDSDPCTRCVSGQNRLTSSPCTCMDGYYQDGQKQDCAQCDNTKCATCTNYSNCIFSCDSSCKTCNKLGYCTSCEYNQKIYNNKCVCDGQNRSNNFPSCQCNDGYYNVGTQKDCQKCDDSLCGTCQYNAQTCITPCNNTCQKCNTDGTCSQCSDNQIINSGNCVCVTGIGRSNSFPSCNCIDGYYQNGSNSDCAQCDNSVCGTCQNGNTNCITPCNNTCQNCNTNGTCSQCSANQIIQNGNCVCVSGIGRSISFPSCNCIEGYYQNGSNSDCGLCDDSKCGTCQNSNDNCIIQCHNSCKTCNTDGTCKTCDQNQELNSGQCICVTGLGRNSSFPQCDCLDGYYQIGNQHSCGVCDDNICGTCTSQNNNCIIPCHSSCKKCNIDGTCKLCISGQYIKDGICVTYQQLDCINCLQQTMRNIQICPCERNQYLQIQSNSSFTCESCIYPCAECCDSTFCQKCVNDINREPIPNCNCLPGYYNDPTTNICSKCHYKCKLCSSYDVCLDNQCSDINRDTNNNCLCKQGYYDSQQKTCQKCQYPCKTCQNQNTCITCENISLENRDSNCHCNQGYYHDQSKLSCQKCDIQCEKCQLTSDNCQKCNIQLNNKQFAMQHNRENQIKYKCSCQKGFYSVDKQSFECKPCNYPCLQCVNSNTCVNYKCVNKKFRYPNCQCYDGYFDNGQNCVKQ